MANQNTVFGARGLGSLIAAAQSGQVNAYTVVSTDATALYRGDFVKLSGLTSKGQDGVEHPVVTQAAASDTLVGFVVGFQVDSDNLNQIYRTASTLRTVYIADDPYVEFEIQAQGTLTSGDIGLNAEIIVGTPSTETGLSGMELDLSTKVSTTAQLRIKRMSTRPDNGFGQYGKVICLINEHQYKGTVGV